MRHLHHPVSPAACCWNASRCALRFVSSGLARASVCPRAGQLGLYVAAEAGNTKLLRYMAEMMLKNDGFGMNKARFLPD